MERVFFISKYNILEYMGKICWLTILLHCCGFWAFGMAEAPVQFYTENLHIRYDQSMLATRCTQINEKGISSFYRQLSKTKYQVLLDDLQEKRRSLELNDWLAFQLMEQSVQIIFTEKSQTEQALICWFLLSKQGFDTRITYLDANVFVNIFTEDEVFEMPIIEDGGRSLVNITNGHREAATKDAALYLLNFKPNPAGKAFRFYLQQPPKLAPTPDSRALQFTYADSTFQVKVQFDKTMVEVMEHYPLIAEEQYLELPMSTILEKSLLPQFRDILINKTPQQSLELLLAFTRSSFEYKEDKAYFGRSKPMIADEVFHFPYSDCEDRSALFYAMVKNLLELPMIIIAFPDHLTVGVQLEADLPGAVIEYNEKRYYICDPTGPVDSAEIGVFPKSYQNSDFKIITHYK